MPFRFPLQTVLHLYQGLERQQELRLRTANQQVSRVRHAIEQVLVRAEQTKLLHCRQLQTGITAAEMHFLMACDSALQLQHHELDRELARLQAFRDRQLQIFEQARRDRETFESLRDRQHREYDRDADRRAQREIDDLALLRRRFLTHG